MEKKVHQYLDVHFSRYFGETYIRRGSTEVSAVYLKKEYSDRFPTAWRRRYAWRILSTHAVYRIDSGEYGSGHRGPPYNYVFQRADVEHCDAIP